MIASFEADSPVHTIIRLVSDFARLITWVNTDSPCFGKLENGRRHLPGSRELPNLTVSKSGLNSTSDTQVWFQPIRRKCDLGVCEFLGFFLFDCAAQQLMERFLQESHRIYQSR